MPLMRPPPGFRGSYNGIAVDAVVRPDAMINVLPRDVAAHEAEGWEIHADTTLAIPAALDGEE